MNKVKVTEQTTLDELYDESALTIEGLSPDDKSLGQFLEWIRGYTNVKDETFYIINGETMNRAYGLTGDNAYPKDCHLVSIKNSALTNPMKVAIPRFSVGGRWFDDIVDNNACREEA